jgi:hypothetical protein
MNIFVKGLLGALMGLPLYILYRSHFPDASVIQVTCIAMISAQFGLIYFKT